MHSLAINHMTAPSASFEGLLDLAIQNDCNGVELRNDLDTPMFSGLSAVDAGALAKAKGVRILGLAQINEFNRFTDNKEVEVQQLIQLAKDCNAAAICLIPCNDGTGCDEVMRIDDLRHALTGIAPLLRNNGIKGLIEPLGFISSSLRSKAEVVAEINRQNLNDCFGLVHDTFHHYLAGGGPIFPEQTGILHVSGVTDKTVLNEDLDDAYRGLVDSADILDNTGQLEKLIQGGFKGAVSMEAFSPEVHQLPDLAAKLRDSFNFLGSSVAAVSPKRV